jgi:prepilin-type N-terminal cleavage/methylation domain-containing protein
MVKNRRRQHGFTIVELLIATAVFSVVLLVFLTALVRISELFYKGVSMSNTQEAARNVIQDISDDLQFYNRKPVIGSNYFCVGIHRYSYNIAVKVGVGGNHGITRETITGACPSPATQPVNYATGEELLDPGMQLNQFSLTPCPNSLCQVHLHLVFYGDDNRVFFSSTPGYVNDIHSASYNADKAPDAVCTGDDSSSQFCSVADYDSTILQN